MRDERSEQTRRHDAHRPAERGGIRSVHLDESGLRRILGSLEADILAAVWAATADTATAAAGCGWTTIGAVCQRLGPDAHYKTIQTVMNRLVEKSLLVRREHARAYEYQATLSRDDLVAQVTHEVVRGLVQDFGAVAVAQLVQTLQAVSPEHVALLEQLAAGDTPASPYTSLQEGGDTASSSEPGREPAGSEDNRGR